jgi:hypothetical protein
MIHHSIPLRSSTSHDMHVVKLGNEIPDEDLLEEV